VNAITGECAHPGHEGPRAVPAELLAFEITGFERERTQGGTNHVELRRRTGVAWCVSCVDFEKLKREHGGEPGRLDL
jgi:hypothetical protein